MAKTGKSTERIIFLLGTRNVPMLIKILNREFDDEKINPSSKLFDKEHAKGYEDFLLSILEADVIKIPVIHSYRRIKIISMREQPEWLKKQGYIPPREREGFASPKGSDRSGAGKPVKVYKNWAHA